jgi:hypothetical protein
MECFVRGLRYGLPLGIGLWAAIAWAVYHLVEAMMP